MTLGTAGLLSSMVTLTVSRSNKVLKNRLGRMDNNHPSPSLLLSNQPSLPSFLHTECVHARPQGDSHKLPCKHLIKIICVCKKNANKKTSLLDFQVQHLFPWNHHIIVIMCFIFLELTVFFLMILFKMKGKLTIQWLGTILTIKSIVNIRICLPFCVNLRQKKPWELYKVHSIFIG